MFSFSWVQQNNIYSNQIAENPINLNISEWIYALSPWSLVAMHGIWIFVSFFPPFLECKVSKNFEICTNLMSEYKLFISLSFFLSIILGFGFSFQKRRFFLSGNIKTVWICVLHHKNDQIPSHTKAKPCFFAEEGDVDCLYKFLVDFFVYLWECSRWCIEWKCLLNQNLWCRRMQIRGLISNDKCIFRLSKRFVRSLFTDCELSSAGRRIRMNS